MAVNYTSGQNTEVVNATTEDLFATSGDNFLYVDNEITFAFEGPVFGFGFYGTDNDQIQDIQFTINFSDGRSSIFSAETSDNEVNSLFFAGFLETDNKTTISSISIVNSDTFGIDDIIIVTSIPEPRTAIISILGLLALMRLRTSKVIRKS